MVGGGSKWKGSSVRGSIEVCDGRWGHGVREFSNLPRVRGGIVVRDRLMGFRMGSGTSLGVV